MKLELNETDMAKLSLIIGELPHKYAVSLIQFLSEIQRRQRAAEGTSN